jgi:phosphoglycolate phosphatase-like HAD superfamily hydrolase
LADVVAVDLDGTILDAEPRQVALATKVVRDLTGRELDGPAFWRLKRAGATTLQTLAKLGFDEDDARRAAILWTRDIELPPWLALDRPLEGALAALERLRDYCVVVITARQSEPRAREELERLGIASRVDRLMVVPPARAAEDKASVLADTHALAFIGDTETDALAATLARVPFVAVSTGQRDKEFLAANGCLVEPSLRAACEWVRANCLTS